MLFNSIHFLVFAPLVIVPYFMLPLRGQRVLLLASSLYFYAVFRVPFTAVLLLSIGATHLAALALDNLERPWLRSWVLWAGILANLSILFFLKYIDFAVRVLNQAFGLVPCTPAAFEQWGVIIPMGISFFTLQAIGYLVDVYRRDISATRSIYQFALFLSFFPQLVAGPIMRASDLLHQFSERHRFDPHLLRSGLVIASVGIFKKTMVADPTGVVVDRIFAAPHEYGALALVLSSLLFVIQIYCDFSGYSDVAIGVGRVMGFDIPLNFNRPLLGDSITDLWRRWHISLSTWLRDYVYIPLGGSRVSPARVYMNVGASMVVGGVWHGAAWTFVLWGLCHTFFITVERIAFSYAGFRSFFASIPRVFRTGYTVFLFTVAAFFFRSQPVAGSSLYVNSMDAALTMFGRIAELAGGKGAEVPMSVVLAIGLLFTGEALQEHNASVFDRIEKNSLAAGWFVGSVVLLAFCIYAVTASPQFIYFQF